MKHITTFENFINENFIKESINTKDIKVGTILNFNDGETWKVTKTSGIASGKIFAAPYGDTKKNYVSLPIEFSVDKLEKDVKSLSESQVNEADISLKNISDIEHTRLIKWIGQNLNSNVDVVKSTDGFTIDASKIPSRDKNDLIKYLKSSDYLNESYTNEASAFMAKDVAKTVAYLTAEVGPEPGYIFFGHNEDIEDFDKLWKKKKYQEALDMLAQDREIEAQTFDDVKPWTKQN